MVSKRENIATHHLYQAWDPVPSLSPATTGTCRQGPLVPGLEHAVASTLAAAGGSQRLRLSVLPWPVAVPGALRTLLRE